MRWPSGILPTVFAAPDRSAPHGRRTTGSSRATHGSPCKKLAQLGYKVNEFDAHIDFDLRDNIRAEQVKFGMVPDGHPTDALLAKLGIDTR